MCTIKDLGTADRMCVTQKFCLVFLSETISAICLEFGFILNIAKNKTKHKTAKCQVAAYPIHSKCRI